MLNSPARGAKSLPDGIGFAARESMETITLTPPARSRTRRIALRIVIGLAVVFAALWIAFHLLKNSAPVRRLVGNQLTQMLGRSVTVEDLRYGDSQVEARLRIGEELTVESAVLNKSWVELVRGESPTVITLQNVQLRLAFTNTGELKSQLPSLSGSTDA